MKSHYVLNTYFFEHLADYRIQQKDIARCLNISEAAVSQTIKRNRCSMQFTDCIAELGRITQGSLMMIEGQSANHISQVQKYVAPPKRLYRLIADLKSIYKTMKRISEATGVSVEKLRLMKKQVYDEKYGWVTDPAVLNKILYQDFLTLLSHIDNVNPWLYINDENGIFPINESMANSHIPAKAFKHYREEKEAELKETVMAKEEIDSKYNTVCQQKQYYKEENKRLSALLKAEKESNQEKVKTTSRLRTNEIIMRRGLEAIKAQLNMIEKHVAPNNENDALNGIYPYILSIRRIIKDTEKNIN